MPVDGWLEIAWDQEPLEKTRWPRRRCWSISFNQTLLFMCVNTQRACLVPFAFTSKPPVDQNAVSSSPWQLLWRFTESRFHFSRPLPRFLCSPRFLFSHVFDWRLLIFRYLIVFENTMNPYRSLILFLYRITSYSLLRFRMTRAAILIYHSVTTVWPIFVSLRSPYFVTTSYALHW